MAGQLAPAQALTHQPAHLERALPVESHQPALVFDCLAQVLAEGGQPLLSAELIQRCGQCNRCDVVHPLERIEVRDGITIGPRLAGVQQVVLKRVLKGRGERL